MLGRSINNTVYRHIVHEPRLCSTKFLFAIKLKRKFQFAEIFSFRILCESEFHGTLSILRFSGRHDAASSFIDNNRKFSRKKILLTWWACQQFSNRFLISTSKFVDENEFQGFKAHASALFIHHSPCCALSRFTNTSAAPSPAAYTVAVDDCQQWLKLKMTSCPIDFPDISCCQRFIFQYIFLITMAAVDERWKMSRLRLFILNCGSSGALGVDVNIFQSGILR